jgi:hypothetical protein
MIIKKIICIYNLKMRNKILKLIVEIRYPTNYDYKNISEFLNKIKHPFVSSEMKIIDKNEGINIPTQTVSEISYINTYKGTENICKTIDKMCLPNEFEKKI